MNRILVIMGLKYLANKYDGQKTYIGAAGTALTGLATILLGISGLIGGFYPDSRLPAMETESAIGSIIAGWGVISAAAMGAGLRHAADKK